MRIRSIRVKSLWTTATVLALSLLLASCSGLGASTSRDLIIETRTSWKQETVELEKKIDGFKYPYFRARGNKIAETLNAKVDALLGEYFDPILQDPSSLGEYPEFSLEATKVAGVGPYISYQLTGYTFVGDAAHGMPVNEVYVFNQKTQKQVFLSYFVPDLSNREISALINKQLLMQLGFNSDLTDFVPQSLSDVSRDIRWWPTSEGINLSFPVYSVAPYSEGPQQGFISWVDIRDQYPDSSSEIYGEIDSYVPKNKIDHYLHYSKNNSGTFIMVTRVTNQENLAETVGFWWASEGIYYYQGKVTPRKIDYEYSTDDGNTEPFSLTLLSSYPLVFNGDAKVYKRVIGPVSDLKYIDYVLSKLQAPIATSLFLDAENAGWMNSSSGD